MNELSSALIGLSIYTPRGIYVGKVDHVAFDVTNRRIDGLVVNAPSPVVAEPNVSISIPYRWISAIGDVILLRIFPDRILRNGTLQGL